MIWWWWNDSFHRQQSSVDIIYSRPVSGVWCLSSLLIWSNHEVGQFRRIEIWRRAEVVARLEDGGQEDRRRSHRPDLRANFLSILNNGDAELLHLTSLLTCWCESGFPSWTPSRWILAPALILTADSESDPLSLRRVPLQTCSRCRSSVQQLPGESKSSTAVTVVVVVAENGNTNILWVRKR